MPRFVYSARSEIGLVNGVQDAASSGAAADLIRSRGLVPLNIRPEGGAASVRPSSGASALSNPGAATGLSAPVALPAFLGPKVSHQDLMLFSRQLHTLLKAGVPILRALTGMQETAVNPAMKAVLLELRRSLESGVELSASMAQNPKVFDSFYVSMVKVGESSGKLEQVFFRLYKHLEFDAFMRQQVKSATRYPMFVVTAMAGALWVINAMVIPSFSGVFKALGSNLPVPTQILLATSRFTVDHGWLLVMAAVLAFVAFRFWVRQPAGKVVWHRILLSLPIVGPIVQQASLSRFARSFALSLRAGMPMERALAGVSLAADNAYISARIDLMLDTVTRGETLARAAAATGVFTPIVLQMISIGEETGMIDDLLDEIGELYGNEVEYSLKTLSQQIEPILIMFMGGLVLILALGVFLPMWDLGGAAFKQ